MTQIIIPAAGSGKRLNNINPNRIPKSLIEIEERKIIDIQLSSLQDISISEFIFVDQIPHFLELNSIPGMTNESIFPKQAKNIGISVKEIIDELIEQTFI